MTQINQKLAMRKIQEKELFHSILSFLFLPTIVALPIPGKTFKKYII